MSEKQQPLAALRPACLILVLAAILLSLGGCTGTLAREGAGGDSLAARGGVKPETRSRAAQPRVASKAAVPVPGPVGIQISYRLDPWLLSGNYGTGFWGSPPVLGPATQGGRTFVVQARALAPDPGGRPITDAEWVPADPAMVRVTPSRGSDVKITVEGAGQSTLRVKSGGTTKELVIKAEYRGDAIQVEIAQQP
jgi:hypothetical protein